jgi:hypothetical protein
MNQEVKQKWLEALRSGTYKQGIRLLRSTTNEYCCLGVLCDLHAKETNTLWCTSETRDNARTYLDEALVLPTPVKQWAGLISDNPLAMAGPKKISKRTLASLNDCGSTFTEIAAIIEEQQDEIRD